MGWFTRMIGIPTFGAAQNALFVEAMLPALDAKLRNTIKTEMVTMFWAAGGRDIGLAAVLERLSDNPRIVQLNLIALALNNMGIAPPFKNEFWSSIKNPFMPNLASDDEVWAAAKRLRSAHNVDLTVGHEQIDFSAW